MSILLHRRLRTWVTIPLYLIVLLALSGAQAIAQSYVPNRLLVKFNPQATQPQIQGLLKAAGARSMGEIGHTGVSIIQLPEEADEMALANAFRNRPEVRFAEVDAIRRPQDVTPNDPLYSTTYDWHLRKIACPTAWSTTMGSSNVIIAILDTGVNGSHEDLKNQVVAGWNFYDNNSNTADVYNHGTGVAGVAAAQTNNGIGVSSVAGGCKIMPIRISDTTGSATFSAMASGLTWAADHGARVANISYIASDSSTVSSAAQYFQSKGGVVTVAAGNNSTFDSTSDNPYVLTVSATDSNDVIASWSNTGLNVDLCAPGVGLGTTDNGGGYTQASGTSVAAPVVAGVAALIISVKPGLTASQIQDILKQSADDFGAAGWDSSYGWGRVNAYKAVQQALNTSSNTDTTPPTVSVTSPAVGATVTGTVTITANASDNVGVTSVAFYVDAALVSTSAASPYSYSWNSSSVANGGHTLKAVASDAAGNTASSSVSITVSNVTDTSPPTANILTPSSSTKVGNPLSVTASATDNVGVTRVELYVDGKLFATDTSSPYTFSVNTRKWAVGSSHTIQCIAYDAAGNSGASQVVSVYK